MPTFKKIAAAAKASAANASAGVDKPILHQIKEMGRLWLAHRLTPGEYIAYGLGRLGVSPTEMGQYVSNRWHWSDHLPRLNSPSYVPVLRNKWIFDRFFRSHDAPLPRTVGVWHPVVGHTAGARPLTTVGALADEMRLLGTGVALKPVDGSQGADIYILESADRDGGSVCFSSADGEVISGDELFSRCFDGKRRRSYLVQERLLNHSALRVIGAGATTSIRVVTLRTVDGEVLIPFALARFGRAGSIVDNYSRGGVLANIAPETGVLEKGRHVISGGWTWSATHPDTGAQIEGTKIPEWVAVVETVRTVSSYLPALKVVGWDIIVTETGPVLLEGNHDWGIMMMQTVGSGYLRDPSVKEALRAHGVSLPPDTAGARHSRKSRP